MRYSVKLEKDGTGYFVSFPDIPEALTQGDSREEALEMARDALMTALEFYFEDSQKIPTPDPRIAEGEFVELPASVVAKIHLLNEFLDSGLSQVELAARMKVTKQEIQRLFNLKHATKIDTLQRAMRALGKDLNIDFREQLDVYRVENVPERLDKVLREGTTVTFAASPRTDPGSIRFYSARLVEDEHLESSFVVVMDIREINYKLPDDVKLSTQPVASFISNCAALAVNCLLPDR